ncbi:MAG: SDR family NAD(P)-dependent oxidoreductase [Phototrophicaceae bacterium]
MANQVVFISGASSGIGYATTLELLRAGYHVAGTSRTLDNLSPLLMEIQQLPNPHGEFLPLACDVTQQEEVALAIQQAHHHFGRLHVVIANAGIGQRGDVVNAPWEDIEVVLRTNIDGVFHTVREGVRAIRSTGEGGHLVMISSVTFNMTSPGMATYAASKGFVSSLAKSLRMELEADNITVSDILVGRTHTNFNKNRRGGERTAQGVSSMSAEVVARHIVRAIQTRQHTVTIRFIDRLIIWANVLAPQIIANIVKKQYSK